MRKVIYRMSVSLDGFIEAADGDLSWSNPDEELYRHIVDREKMIDIHFYGRGMYENMSSFWATADDDLTALPVQAVSALGVDVKEYARFWRDMKKIVFSRTLSKVGWNSELAAGDIAGVVNRLKAQPGNDMSVGGAGIAASFMRLGLIDEYCLYVRPVILGGGKPMFQNPNGSIELKLIEARQFGSGAVLLRYRNKDK